MKTIQIESPAGFVPSFDPEKCVLSFSEAPKNIRERLQVFNDVLAFHDHTEESFASWCNGLRTHEIGLRKEELIVAAYNGWKLSEKKLPDFTDGEYKYCPYFKMPSPSGSGFAFSDYVNWNANSAVGARLLFCGPEAKKNLYDAVEKFLPEYEQSRTL